MAFPDTIAGTPTEQNFGSIIGQMENNTKIVEDIYHRLATLYDRITGESSESKEQPRPTPVPNGILNAMQQEINRQNSLAHSIDSQLNRIERLL